MDGSDRTYSVIGVRADSSRHVLSLKLSLDDANYLQRMLIKADIFRAVLVAPRDAPQEAEFRAGAAGDGDERCA